MKKPERLFRQDGGSGGSESFGQLFQKEKRELSEKLEQGLPIVHRKFKELVPNLNIPDNSPQIKTALLVLACHYFADRLIDQIGERNNLLKIIYRDELTNVATSHVVVMEFRAIRDLRISITKAVGDSSTIFTELIDMVSEVVEQVSPSD